MGRCRRRPKHAEESSGPDMVRHAGHALAAGDHPASAASSGVSYPSGTNSTVRAAECRAAVRARSGLSPLGDMIENKLSPWLSLKHRRLETPAGLVAFTSEARQDASRRTQ